MQNIFTRACSYAIVYMLHAATLTHGTILNPCLTQGVYLKRELYCRAQSKDLKVYGHYVCPNLVLYGLFQILYGHCRFCANIVSAEQHFYSDWPSLY